MTAQGNEGRPGVHREPPDATAWRVLSDAAQDGAQNMAVDEAIARAVESAEVPPTLRFYAWKRPTVSLGFLQAAGGAVTREACDRLAVGIVRRPTGGRAVLHGDELTYSLCVPLDQFWTRCSVGESFYWIGEGLVGGLRCLGIDAALGRTAGVSENGGAAQACFQTPRMPAVLVAGKKLVGSAQRRWGGVLLQHGSVLLGVDLPMHQAVFPGWPREDPGAGVTWMRALLCDMPSRSDLEQALLRGWMKVLNIRGVPGELTSSERCAAERLVVTRYATPAWTWRR